MQARFLFKTRFDLSSTRACIQAIQRTVCVLFDDRFLCFLSTGRVIFLTQTRILRRADGCTHQLMSAGQDHFCLLFAFSLTLPNAGSSSTRILIFTDMLGRFVL